MVHVGGLGITNLRGCIYLSMFCAMIFCTFVGPRDVRSVVVGYFGIMELLYGQLCVSISLVPWTLWLHSG